MTGSGTAASASRACAWAEATSATCCCRAYCSITRWKLRSVVCVFCTPIWLFPRQVWPARVLYALQTSRPSSWLSVTYCNSQSPHCDASQSSLILNSRLHFFLPSLGAPHAAQLNERRARITAYLIRHHGSLPMRDRPFRHRNPWTGRTLPLRRRPYLRD